MPVRIKRKWALSFLVFILAGMVWWFRIYSPLKEEAEILHAAIAQKDAQIQRTELRLKRLANTQDKRRKMLARQARLSRMVSLGKSVEQANAETQLWAQGLLEKFGITLRTYKEMTPVKWRDHQVGMVQSQLNASIQGLSDLLQRIEKMDKAVRLEAMTVTYRKNKEDLLQVSFDLGTLVLEEKKTSAPF